MTWFEEVRCQIPAAHRLVYLETAATSPLPDFVRSAVANSMERRAWSGEGFYDDAIERANGVRRTIADHLGVSADGIAFMKNTGEGLNHVAKSLDFDRGANVVISGLEFPSNRLPWRALERHGLEVRVAPNGDHGMGPTPDDFAQLIDHDTALVSTSWVTFQTGYRIDVETIGRIAHEHDALMMVDGIQGMGAIAPPDMRHIDFWANGGHKWLMAPFGAGFLYARPELLPDIEPDHLGWWNLEDYTDFDSDAPALAKTARRFEIGNLAVEIIEGLGAAVTNIPPIEQVEQRIHHLTTRLIEGIGPLGRLGTPSDPERRAGIIRFETEDAERVHARLRERMVYASLRSGAVRFSPHYWNTEAEIDRTVDTVRAVLGS